MSDIKDFISNILLGNNVEAKENFNDLLSARAMDALGERKQQIAQSLFQSEERIEEEVEHIEEGPVGAALGGVAGTMLGGPVGGALGAYLGHKAGNLTGAGAKKVGKAAGGALKSVGRGVKKVGAIGAGALAGGAVGGPVGAALGGYAGHRLTKEDAESIDEISKSTLGSYIKKASHDVAAKGATTRRFAMDSEKQRKDQDYVGARKSMEKADKTFAKSWKRREGMAKAVDRLTKEDVESIEEKAVSQQQQKFMGMVYAAKKGMKPASPEVAKAAASMTKQQAKDYAATKHKGLPSKVEEENDKENTNTQQQSQQKPATTVQGAMKSMQDRQKMLQDI